MVYIDREICVAGYLVASSDDLLDSVVVEVIPIGDLDLGPKRRVDRLHSDLGEGCINVQNTSHCDGVDSAQSGIECLPPPR